MNIGSLYTVKKYFWFLFPTKETAIHGEDEGGLSLGGAVVVDNGGWLIAANASQATPAGIAASTAAAGYWSKQYNCEVNYFSPETLIVFLEEDGKYKKFLTSDGRIGWTWVHEKYIHCFEEANP